jgi:hypothetical protein
VIWRAAETIKGNYEIYVITLLLQLLLHSTTTTTTTIIIIIIIITSFMQGIYTYIPEINYDPRVYSVAAILL